MVCKHSFYCSCFKSVTAAAPTSDFAISVIIDTTVPFALQYDADMLCVAMLCHLLSLSRCQDIA